MIRLVALSALVIGLAACGSEEGLRKILDSYVGANENALVSRTGIPDRTYTNGDTKFLSCRKANSGYVPGTPPSYYTSCGAYTCATTPVGGSAGFAYNNHCTVTFTVQGGRVANYRYEGNACLA